jgi:hypothetical protein
MRRSSERGRKDAFWASISGTVRNDPQCSGGPGSTGWDIPVLILVSTILDILILDELLRMGVPVSESTLGLTSLVEALVAKVPSFGPPSEMLVLSMGAASCFSRDFSVTADAAFLRVRKKMMINKPSRMKRPITAAYPLSIMS